MPVQGVGTYNTGTTTAPPFPECGVVPIHYLPLVVPKRPSVLEDGRFLVQVGGTIGDLPRSFQAYEALHVLPSVVRLNRLRGFLHAPTVSENACVGVARTEMCVYTAGAVTPFSWKPHPSSAEKDEEGPFVDIRGPY